MTCTYIISPRDGINLHSLISSSRLFYHCLGKYVINTKANGRHIDLKLNWIALIMKLNWIALMIRPFAFLSSKSTPNSLPVIMYVFLWVYTFNACHMRINHGVVHSEICKVNTPPPTSYDLAFSFLLIYEHFGLVNYFGERLNIRLNQ